MGVWRNLSSCESLLVKRGLTVGWLHLSCALIEKQQFFTWGHWKSPHCHPHPRQVLRDTWNNLLCLAMGTTVFPMPYALTTVQVLVSLSRVSLHSAAGRRDCRQTCTAASGFPVTCALRHHFLSSPNSRDAACSLPS